MDPKYAVLCVQHDYVPKETTKMDGVPQSAYPRKNWSSYMLVNCGHDSTKQLTPELVNSESGAYLHRMQWAKDGEIEAPPVGWNWLEGWYDKPEQGYPQAVHYTRGGPWFKEWQDVDYATEWLAEAAEYKAKQTCVAPRRWRSVAPQPRYCRSPAHCSTLSCSILRRPRRPSRIARRNSFRNSMRWPG